MFKLKQSDTKNVTFIVHMNVTFKIYQSQLQKPPAFVFMILILDLTYCNINLEGWRYQLQVEKSKVLSTYLQQKVSHIASWLVSMVNIEPWRIYWTMFPRSRW